MIKNIFLDKVGIFASSLCAVHCLATAFLPGIILVLGFDMLLSSRTEWLFTCFAILMACLAFYSGYKKHHSKMIATIFVIGITGLILSRVIEESGGHEHSEHHTEVHETAHHEEEHNEGLDLHLLGSIIGIGSGLTILAAHFLNMQKSKCSAQA